MRAPNPLPAIKKLPPARERILEAADLLFMRYGTQIPVQMIAEQARTNTPAVERLFRFNELVMIFLKDLADREQGIWNDLEILHPNDPCNQILAWTTRYAGWPDEGTYAFRRALCELPKGHPGRELMRRHKLQQRAELERLCVSAGFPKAAMLADRLYLLAEGVQMTELAIGEEGPTKAARALAVALMRAQRPDISLQE
jgi:AcrR family transcriptional regulator